MTVWAVDSKCNISVLFKYNVYLYGLFLDAAFVAAVQLLKGLQHYGRFPPKYSLTDRLQDGQSKNIF